MCRLLSILVVAVLAMTTLAAPAPTKTISKRSFAAKVKGRRKLSGPEALQRAARKYGFEVSIPESDDKARRWDFGEAFSHHHHHEDSSWPSNWPVPSGFGQLFSSIEFFSVPASSASAAPSGFGGSPSGFSVVPSGAPSSSIVVSSGAPPVQSSVPAPHGSASAPDASASAPAASSSASPSSGSANGVVGATPQQSGSLYVSPVTIGGNQQLDLDFDTGSSDLWVFDSQAISGHTGFDPSKSNSFQPYQGGSWSITYGDQSGASGTVGFDTVTIGGVTAPKQAVELAQKVSSTFKQDANNDGLLGLGFSSINQVLPQPQKTFFENVMGSLEQPLFTADLEQDSSGTYEFGNIDSSKFTGSLHYTPIDNSRGWWMFPAGPFSVGGSQQACSGCDPFIVDTGTTLLILDDQIVQAYYKQVQGASFDQTQGAFLYPCSTTLPDFSVDVGRYTATIKGADLMYAQAGGGVCFGAIQPGGSTAQVNILGDVFLKQFFTVFDGGNMRLGVAPK